MRRSQSRRTRTVVVVDGRAGLRAVRRSGRLGLGMSGAERQFVLMVSPSDVVAQNRMVRVNAASLPGTDDKPLDEPTPFYPARRPLQRKGTAHTHGARTHSKRGSRARFILSVS